jgi:hypothetical protein
MGTTGREKATVNVGYYNPNPDLNRSIYHVQSRKGKKIVLSWDPGVTVTVFGFHSTVDLCKTDIHGEKHRLYLCIPHFQV